MKIYVNTFFKKHTKEKDDFPFGIHFYDGIQGAGKTLSMVFDTIQICKKYKDVVIISNVLFKKPIGGKIVYFSSVDSLINKIKENEEQKAKHTIILIDEGLTYFAENGGIDPALMSQITQNRKNRRLIFIATQKFKRLNNRIRDFSVETIVCKSFLNFQINTVRDDEKLVWDKEQMDFVGEVKYRYIFKRYNQLYDFFDTLQKIELNKKIKMGNNLSESGNSPPLLFSDSIKVKK